ncbi:MAG: helix-hairpin-helix domain-containing protein [Flavobacteriaceae bacterium]|nr:helix-hairpin-helix domain-containing protein [Flavobacteriaceae bacterium]
MNRLKSHFRFSKNQRNGILLLIATIVTLQIIYYKVDFSKDPVLDINSPEIIALQTEIDSLKQIASNSKQREPRKFNPNFITEYSGYTLGMSPEEIDRLHEFRTKDQWINSVADFKRVTQVSDSLLDEISPRFQFPDWVTNPRHRTNNWNSGNEKSFAQKTDLNTATAEQLQEINGVGEVLSNRIINFRNRLNGFLIDEQLHDVYGLEYGVVKRILAEFTVKEKPEVVKININTASASDMATLPFISFNLAKEIVDYRLLREGIKDLEELKNIKGFPKQKIERFALYLTVD